MASLEKLSSFFGGSSKKPERNRTHNKKRERSHRAIPTGSTASEASEYPDEREWSDWAWDDTRKKEYRMCTENGVRIYQLRSPREDSKDDQDDCNDEFEQPIDQGFHEDDNTQPLETDEYLSNDYTVSASPPTSLPIRSTTAPNTFQGHPTTITDFRSPRSVESNRLPTLTRTAPLYDNTRYQAHGRVGANLEGESSRYSRSVAFPKEVLPESAVGYGAGGERETKRHLDEDDEDDEDDEASDTTSRRPYHGEVVPEFSRSLLMNPSNLSHALPVGVSREFSPAQFAMYQAPPMTLRSGPGPSNIAQAASTVASTDGPRNHYIAADNPALLGDDDPKFRVHPGRDFQFGRVFKIRWAEPKGETADGPPRQEFQKVRPFLIIRRSEGHCGCLPILTYGGRATTKPGVKPSHHTIIHTKRRNEATPKELPDEKKLLKKPIRVLPISALEQLDPRSRLNYYKIYTIEWNVRVQFIGNVDPNHIDHLKRDFNVAQPPLTESPDFKYSHEDSGPNDDRTNDHSSKAGQRGGTRKYSLPQSQNQHVSQSRQPATSTSKRVSVSHSSRPQGSGGLQSAQNPQQSSERITDPPQREPSRGRGFTESYEPIRDTSIPRELLQKGEEPIDDRINDRSSKVGQRGSTRKNSLPQSQNQSISQSRQLATSTNRRASISHSSRPQGSGGLQSAQNPQQSSARITNPPQREPSRSRGPAESYESTRGSGRPRELSQKGEEKSKAGPRRDLELEEPRDLQRSAETGKDSSHRRRDRN